MKKISGLEAAKEIYNRISRSVLSPHETMAPSDATMNALTMIGTMHSKFTLDEWLDVWITIVNFNPENVVEQLTQSTIIGNAVL